MEAVEWYSPKDAEIAALFEKYRKRAIIIEGKVMFMETLRTVQVPKKGWFSKGDGKLYKTVSGIVFVTYDMAGERCYKEADRIMLCLRGWDEEVFAAARQEWVAHMKFMESLGFSIVNKSEENKPEEKKEGEPK